MRTGSATGAVTDVENNAANARRRPAQKRLERNSCLFFSILSL